ncbi:shikimate dehydrogenase family protein [Chryseosolibacter indicus]|uniref:Shikimate dehydrogenase n=1 Tax=Chryseosolibacter indicus TaxID=2782351 RepID=A0ABS5VY21_9BACT|nr:shikimate dehydrogenase [Chryseosolibacter indicus]MBT1705742.1 shikimate dehydrogenase [Chryseosolibacter indicus]
MEKVFGLIGQTVSHSFSKAYFDEKFFREGLRDYHYELFPLNNIKEIETLIKETKGLTGLNVTLPYKEQVIQFLDEVDPVAKKIGAVNVIKFKDGKRKGFNTDSDAFYETLEKWLPKEKTFKGLVLGSGGSSKAVQEALKKLKIEYKIVSREKSTGNITYQDLEKNPKIIAESLLLINTTPLGMHPNTDTMPPITYDMIGADHYVYDLIYNPARTLFLQKAEMRGALIKNGLEMLHVQAEKSWNIWNN